MACRDAQKPGMGLHDTRNQHAAEPSRTPIEDGSCDPTPQAAPLQKALVSDEAGRRITEPVAGPLFADQLEEGDEASGTIYVLRSKSEHPVVARHRDIVHKIGVTNMSVKQRVARAHLDPTFLMADVEVVATYELFNINRSKLENLIHRIFDPARFEVEIRDRFGRPVVPREWFMVPLFVIDEAVKRIKDRSIVSFVYDPKAAKLVERSGSRAIPD